MPVTKNYFFAWNVHDTPTKSKWCKYMMIVKFMWFYLRYHWHWTVHFTFIAFSSKSNEFWIAIKNMCLNVCRTPRTASSGQNRYFDSLSIAAFLMPFTFLNHITQIIQLLNIPQRLETAHQVASADNLTSISR